MSVFSRRRRRSSLLWFFFLRTHGARRPITALHSASRHAVTASSSYLPSRRRLELDAGAGPGDAAAATTTTPPGGADGGRRRANFNIASTNLTSHELHEPYRSQRSGLQCEQSHRIKCQFTALVRSSVCSQSICSTASRNADARLTSTTFV